MTAGTDIRIGSPVTVERRSGSIDNGTVVNLQLVGATTVAGVRFEDGTIERLQLTRDDALGLAVDRPLVLAQAILDGRPIRMPIEQQLRKLAVAVVAAERDGRVA